MSSSCTSHSDEQQATIDAENAVNLNIFDDGRDESCPADLMRDRAARKIIFDRGFIDGINMRLSFPSELKSVNASNEPVEVFSMVNITNAAMVADVALRSSMNALQAASLAVDLSNEPAEVTAIEAMVTVALDAAKTAEVAASVARSISHRSRRSLGMDE
ncbi:uncharacterized protein LOC115032992 [Acyrthosiphon pisum]|uniref:Uncharacterized protein n=1 Tax=Acyrthosiphon pisum TaxID=7029 RepID=A0A8R1W8D0_ACYPI|nr:uncharacterized protein LOC115032992 [Acyrthosiphon pisum]|eukprot:XP_003243505.1 PREDICTED: uncharacterized protein LOC100568474 [Acyrthosiphon pisum]